MSVTVVIPMHNARATISATIISIPAAAAGVATRVVIVDDGSTDGSVEAAEAAASTLEPAISWKLIRQPQAGSAAARQRGLDEVETPFVLCLDADDLLIPSALAVLVETLASRPDAVAAGGQYEYIAASGRRTGIVSGQVPAKIDRADVRSGRLMPYPPSVTMVRTEAARRCGGHVNPAVELQFAEDLEFMSRLADFGEFLVVPRVLMQYRVSASSKSVAHAAAESAGLMRVRAERTGEDYGRRSEAARRAYRRAGIALIQGERKAFVRAIGRSWVLAPVWTTRRAGQQAWASRRR